MPVIFVNSCKEIRHALLYEGLSTSDTVKTAMLAYADHNFYHAIYTDTELDFIYNYDYDDIYPGVRESIKNYKNKKRYGFNGVMPIGSSMAYTMSYKHNIICAVYANTEYSDVAHTNNLYYATKAIMEVWPQEGYLIINTNNVTITRSDIKQISWIMYEYSKNDRIDTFIFNTVYIPEYNQIRESILEQPEEDLDSYVIC